MATGTISRPALPVDDMGTQIASGTDLRNITALGRYYSPSGTVTTTLTGKPAGISNVGFRMEVVRAGGIYQRQIFVGQSDYPNFFVQNFTNANTYSHWNKVMLDREDNQITAEIYGNFYAGEVTADSIFFKILWPEIWNLPQTVTFSFSYKSSENDNTTSGKYVTTGGNSLSNGWTFGTPYVGGQRMITVRCDKTAHGLTGDAMLNIPPSHAIVITYTKP